MREGKDEGLFCFSFILFYYQTFAFSFLFLFRFFVLKLGTNKVLMEEEVIVGIGKAKHNWSLVVGEKNTKLGGTPTIT